MREDAVVVPVPDKMPNKYISATPFRGSPGKKNYDYAGRVQYRSYYLKLSKGLMCVYELAVG